MIVETIKRARYAASESQVQQLASVVATGRRGDSCYLRVLVAAVQSKLGRRGRTKSARALLDAAHEKFYPAVLRGVGPDTLDKAERTRRATFARSAKSTVRFFLAHGGDIRGLDLESATKGGLRRAVTPEVPAGTRNERIVTRAQEQLLRATARMDTGAARTALANAVQALGAAIDQLSSVGAAQVAEQPAAPVRRHRPAASAVEQRAH